MARLRYLGISFFEIVTDDGKVVYIDPCISINPDCPIALDDIDHADLVLVTHRARDHAADAVPLVSKTGATMVCTRDMFFFAKEEGIPETQLKFVTSGVPLDIAGVRAKSLRTEHGSFSVYNGHPMFDLSVGYLVYIRDEVSVYHVGDTSIFGDFQLFGRLYKPKVMLTPIGMYPGAITEMDPREAAVAVSMVGPEMTIPMHYDRVGQADYPEIFGRHLKAEAPNVELKVLAPGETLEI